MTATMKAWSVHNDETGFSTVVFAETRGKARVAAMATDAMDGYEFVECRVLRCKPMDALYKGKFEADWYDAETRRVLVGTCGWYCIELYTDECETCPALDLCEYGMEFLGENDAAKDGDSA